MPGFLKNRFVWIAVILFAVAAGGGLYLNGQAKAKQAALAKAAAAAAPKSPYVAIANGKADVEGGVIQVAARTAGVIRDVYVHEGDEVKKGQILARLEDDEPRLQAASAEADVRQAKAQVDLLKVQISTAHREYDRLQGLIATNFVARQKVDQAQDAIRQAEAQLEAQQAVIAAAQAKANQAAYIEELTIIRAPADGRIVRRYANPGAGASTLNVSNMFDLEPRAPHIVRAEVSEASLPYVEIGQNVQLAPESDPSKVFTGQVIRRSGVFGARKLQSDDPTEKTDERVVEVVVGADQTPFLIGQRVLVKFMRGQQQAQAASAPRG
jgi:HlyD family secretion protein